MHCQSWSLSRSSCCMGLSSFRKLPVAASASDKSSAEHILDQVARITCYLS